MCLGKVEQRVPPLLPYWRQSEISPPNINQIKELARKRIFFRRQCDSRDKAFTPPYSKLVKKTHLKPRRSFAAHTELPNAPEKAPLEHVFFQFSKFLFNLSSEFRSKTHFRNDLIKKKRSPHKTLQKIIRKRRPAPLKNMSN